MTSANSTNDSSLRRRAALIRIKAQINDDSPEAELLFSIFRQAVIDLEYHEKALNFLHYKHGRKEEMIENARKITEDARDYLNGPCVHLAMLDISADWARETLTACGVIYETEI